MTPNNYEGLQQILVQNDKEQSGLIDSNTFVRCLSSSQMKLTEREVEKLIQELDTENTGKINYQEFLKYSYLVQMYLNHLRLE